MQAHPHARGAHPECPADLPRLNPPMKQAHDRAVLGSSLARAFARSIKAARSGSAWSVGAATAAPNQAPTPAPADLARLVGRDRHQPGAAVGVPEVRQPTVRDRPGRPRPPLRCRGCRRRSRRCAPCHRGMQRRSRRTRPRHALARSRIDDSGSASAVMTPIMRHRCQPDRARYSAIGSGAGWAGRGDATGTSVKTRSPLSGGDLVRMVAPGSGRDDSGVLVDDGLRHSP
jgi:hypothetical protein